MCYQNEEKGKNCKLLNWVIFSIKHIFADDGFPNIRIYSCQFK